jgi:hypothetical protein
MLSLIIRLFSLSFLCLIHGGEYAENSFERQALDMGIRDLKEADNSTRPHDYLCVTFTQLHGSNRIIHLNAASLMHCDWAIIVFESEEVVFQSIS